METQVEKKNGKTIIAAVASAEEVDRALDAGMHEFIRESGLQIPIDSNPQMRRRMIESIGKDAIGEALRITVLDQLAPYAFTASGVVPAIEPEISAKEDPAPATSLSFTVEVIARPEFELNSFGKVAVDVKRDPDETDEEFEQHKISAVTGVWASRLDRDVQPEIRQKFTDRSAESLVRQLAEQGKTVDAYLQEHGLTRDQLTFIVDSNAHAALLSALAMDALVRHYHIKPDLEDERRAALMLVPTADADWAIEHLRETGRGYLLQENAERLAATKWAMSNATVNVLA